MTNSIVYRVPWGRSILPQGLIYALRAPTHPRALSGHALIVHRRLAALITESDDMGVILAQVRESGDEC